jgi:hypothetical protein
VDSDLSEGSGINERKRGGEAEDHLSGVGKGSGVIAHSCNSDPVGSVGGDYCLRREVCNVDLCCCDGGVYSVLGGYASYRIEVLVDAVGDRCDHLVCRG